MTTYRKRNGKWQAIVRHKDIGTRARSFHTKPAAIKWAVGEERKLTEGVMGVLQPSGVTLGQLLRQYVSDVLPAKRGATTELRRLRRLIKDPVSSLKASQLTSQAVAVFRDRRLLDLSLRPHPYQALPKDSDERVGVDAVVQSGRQSEDATFFTSEEPATGRR